MTPPLLSLSGVCTDIGAYQILHGVDLQVPRGGVTLLLGRNGAGKTTTLRTIMGLWRARAGSVMFDGQDITKMATPEVSQLGIAYVPENMGVFTDLTVRENLLLAARRARSLRDIDGARLDAIFAAFPALKKFWEQPAGLLSGGQKQMLSMARAMIEPRQLLLIDEPSKGLAPAIVMNLINTLRALRDAGTTILLVEQNFQFARQLGDTVVVMDNGVAVHHGAMSQLVQDEALQQRLLGLSLGAHQ
jgi:branched-chain amino acid transport system ATP-binding protein